MTASTVRASRWAVAEVDSDRVLAELRRRFPAVPLWRGHATGNWFAIVRRGGADHLMEAGTPAELARWLDAARMREGSRPARRSGSPARPVQPAPFAPSASRVAMHGRHGARRRSWWRRLLRALIVAEEP